MKHEATVRWAGKMTFVGKAGSNHLVPMDSGPEFGGESSATKPMELLLIGLGGCTGMDIVSLFQKMRVDFSGIEMNITADRAEEHPNVYTKIDLEYVIYGRGIDEEKVKRAIDLSQEKYCSVSAMLRKSCPVNYTWRIVAPE
jgi:putative redox protein